MKHFLPKLFFIFSIVSVLLVSSGTKPVYGQVNPSPAIVPFSATSANPAVSQGTTGTPDSQTWVQDADVTFAGKAGKRAGNFLDWTLQNYDWSFVNAGETNPIQDAWVTIRNIVYAFFALFVLLTAFLLIITRGKSITLRKFIPRFLFIVLLVFFSFALVQFLYQTVDVIQGFFLKNPDTTTLSQHPFISQENLLYIGFDYNFDGYRLFGVQYDESVFISLLLVKLTALTYYVMVGILLVRKIILWFFIIISPILPLLLLYAPVRNTGKIWIGEFFRWLLYAPIFAVFLSGLVTIWRAGIPLNFAKNTDIVYPTAINIILGGPKQTIGIANSVNNKDTFALYVVALLMLWVVIILPFLLLQIFLDYLKNVSFSDNVWLKQLVANGSSMIGMTPKAPLPPEGSGSAGLAKQLPFTSKISIPDMSALRQQQYGKMSVTSVETSKMNTELLKLTSLQIPTITDIARYETSMLSKDISRHEEVAKVHESLERIAKPQAVTSEAEKSHYTTVRQKLVAEGQKGNPLASSILAAANTVGKTSAPAAEDLGRLEHALEGIMNPSGVSSTVEKQKFQAAHTQLMQKNAAGDQLAKDIVKAAKSGVVGEDLAKRLLEAKEKGNALASVILQAANVSLVSGYAQIPVINRVQQVSLDDYEAVKKLWTENYQKIEPPKDISGNQPSRPLWLKSEMEKITNTITLLLSADPQKNSKGMEQVGTILPFLLIGGFSKSEIVAYLKAKFEAAKATLETLSQKQEEEETMLDRQEKKTEKPKEMTAAAEEEAPEDKKISHS